MTMKRVLNSVLVVLLVAILGFAIYLNTLLPIITGYAAKNLCSAVFVSGREQNEVESTDLNFSFIKFTNNKIDFIDRSVTSRFLWAKSKAIFRDGFGVTLIRNVNEEDLRLISFPVINSPGYSQDTILWPLGDVIPDTITGIDLKELASISNRLIQNNSYNGNAFAFMVLHKGIPVAEAYKPQFNQQTRFISWSMAKSFTNALVGILVKQGKMDIENSAAIEVWKSDNRNKITLNNLMQMKSGLKWNEDYGNRSDVTVMLHNENDMSRFAYEKPFDVPADTLWYYSSGTANIVNYLIREQFNNDSLYYTFPYTELFENVGITDAIFEVDPAGTFVGSSYLYATTRDYARFGLLYLNDGVFNGKRILPEGWVTYSSTEASASGGEYGSLFWLNKDKSLPSAPENMYMCVGHDGQRIFILPTEELVVVVLGYSPTSKGGMDFDLLLKDIISTL